MKVISSPTGPLINVGIRQLGKKERKDFITRKKEISVTGQLS